MKRANGLPLAIPEEVGAVVEHYLRLVDEALPGRIEGLYMVGSVALDDYVPGQSDVDFVAVAASALGPRELDRVEEVHCRLTAELPRPWFSGVYVCWADLERNPMELTDVPFYLEGQFGRSGGFDANPSIWVTLRNHPVSMRGPAAPSVWYDLDVLRQWNLDNLNSYWQGLASRHQRLLGRGAFMLRDWAIAWCVPGVARLHFTIATGDVTSKSGACHYAMETFPERWHPVIREALAVRSGERVRPRSRLARCRDALAFMQLVIDDANARVSIEDRPK